MSMSIPSIAERIDEICHLNTCKSGKCIVDLTGLPSRPKRLIVNMDCDQLNIPAGSKRCDYIIFLDNPFNEDNDPMIVVPIEMKSGTIRGVTGIIEQIKSGIEYAKKWIDSNPNKFISVLVHRGIHSKNRSELKRTLIKINKNKKSKLILMGCGESLIHKLRQK